MSSPPQNNKEKEKEKDADRPKLKILALHGYRQNGAVFRAKIGSFRKAVAKYAQLVFLSAPHKVVNEDGGGDEGNIFPQYILINLLTNGSAGHARGGFVVGTADNSKQALKFWVDSI